MKLLYKFIVLVIITSTFISCNKEIPSIYIGKWISEDAKITLGITEEKECQYYVKDTELLLGTVKIKEKKKIMKICGGTRCEEYSIDKAPEEINDETYMVLAGDTLYKISNIFVYPKTTN